MLKSRAEDITIIRLTLTNYCRLCPLMRNGVSPVPAYTDQYQQAHVLLQRSCGPQNFVSLLGNKGNFLNDPLFVTSSLHDAIFKRIAFAAAIAEI